MKRRGEMEETINGGIHMNDITLNIHTCTVYIKSAQC